MTQKNMISIRSIYIYSQFTTFRPKQFLPSTILQMMAHSSLPWAWTLYSSGYSSLNASKRASTSHKSDGETEMRLKNIHVPMTSSKRLLSHKNTSWHFPHKTNMKPPPGRNEQFEKARATNSRHLPVFFLLKKFKSCSVDLLRFERRRRRRRNENSSCVFPTAPAPRLVDLHWRFEVLWGRQALKPQRFRGFWISRKKNTHTHTP